MFGYAIVHSSGCLLSSLQRNKIYTQWFCLIFLYCFHIFPHNHWQYKALTCDVKISTCYHSYVSFCLTRFYWLKILSLFFFVIKESSGDQVSCNSFYSKPSGVKSIEYLKLLFISLDIPLVALERGILELTESYLMSEIIEPKWACYNSPRIEIYGMRCNTWRGELWYWVIFNVIQFKWLEFDEKHFILFIFYLWYLSVVLSASSIFVNFSKNRKQLAYPHNIFCTWQKDHFTSFWFLLRNKMKEKHMPYNTPHRFCCISPHRQYLNIFVNYK